MNKVRVAIVEDDEDDRDFISSSMREKNSDLEIMTFNTGGSFLDYISNTTLLPNLIVTDLKMPVVTGFDVIQQIKSNPATKDIVVVVLSTSGNETDIKKAKALGAAGYFIKPYSFSEYSAITGKIVNVFKGGFLSFSKMKNEFLTTFSALLPLRIAT